MSINYTNENLRHIGDALVAIEPGWSVGFFIKPNLIATAAHCLRNRPMRLDGIHLRHGGVISGKIAAIDTNWDVGLISVVPQYRRTTSLSLTKMSSETDISLAVLSRDKGVSGFTYELHHGCVDGWYQPEVNLRMKIHSRQGFSGAPIFGKDLKALGLLHSSNDYCTFGASAEQINCLVAHHNL